MKKVFLVICGLIISGSFANAGETKAYYFIEDSNWAPQRYVVVDGVAHRISGMSMIPADFENSMKSNPKASEYARLSHEAMITGNWVFWGLLGGYALYGATTPAANYNSGVGTVLLLSALFGGGYYFNKSQNYMWSAINVYNGIDLDKVPVKSGFLFSPTTDGAFAQYSLTF